MKPVWLILVALIAGSGMGYGLTWNEFNTPPRPSDWSNLQPAQPDSMPGVAGADAAAEPESPSPDRADRATRRRRTR